MVVMLMSSSSFSSTSSSDSDSNSTIASSEYANEALQHACRYYSTVDEERLRLLYGELVQPDYTNGQFSVAMKHTGLKYYDHDPDPKKLNFFRNILPSNHMRYVLQDPILCLPKENTGCHQQQPTPTDYINATIYFKNNCRFIATQKPTNLATYVQMITEQPGAVLAVDVSNMEDLCFLREIHRIHKLKTVNSGKQRNLQVIRVAGMEIKNEHLLEVNNHYRDVRGIEASKIEVKVDNNLCKEVAYLKFSEWQDMQGVDINSFGLLIELIIGSVQLNNDDISPLLDKVSEKRFVNGHNENEKWPTIIVNCKAGVGRTGTVIAACMILTDSTFLAGLITHHEALKSRGSKSLDFLEKELIKKLMSTIEYLREGRTAMVQTDSQFLTCYKFLYRYITENILGLNPNDIPPATIRANVNAAASEMSESFI